MAYDVNTDYTAKNAELQKALAAATDEATKAALQAQIDANNQSRIEKIASDPTAYGKYATDSELNSAAGLMAQNQIGTTYETQARNIGNYYDTAKQNANNDALSRGMARSTYVSDRMANIDTDRATALTDNDAAKALAIQNAQANILSNYRTNTANALANEKSEYADNKMTYYNDYQAEINNVLGDNDPTNDWKADKLKGWRNEKLLAQEAAALKAAKSYGGGGNDDDGGGNDDDGGGNDDGGGFNEQVIDYTSPYGIITDIADLKTKGYSSAQIKANAKAAYEAGQITGAQYQMYVQYAGRN